MYRPSRMTLARPALAHTPLARRRGQSLVEFALVALVLYLLLAATIELGRAVFGAETLQGAAHVAARELALEPLPAGSTTLEALADEDVRRRVFDAHWLAIDLDADGIDDGVDVANREQLEALFARLPLVNRQLRPLFVLDLGVGLADGTTRDLLRYPGALVFVDPGEAVVDRSVGGLPDLVPSGLSVRIPQVAGRDADGVETIAWVDVVEPFGAPDPFPVAVEGLVALRLNYPFQAAALTGHSTSPDGPFEPNAGLVIDADDAGVVEDEPVGAGGLAVAGDARVGANVGAYGLGRLLAQGREVRPFHKLISVQAVFRREVWE